MPTFIDESGDTGPVSQGGKPYFRMAAVWVPSHSDANVFREKVRRLRTSLGLRGDYEFKYSRTFTQERQREAFFDAAMSQEFRFAVGVVDKTGEHGKTLDARGIYWACATDLAVALRPVYIRAEQAKGSILGEYIVVDNNDDKKYLRVIKSQLRGLTSSIRAESPLVGKVGFYNSATDEMLQLADMICGASGDANPEWLARISERRLA